MNTFKYTITKFDEENKFIVVTFGDGSWAEIRLATPLPADKNALEDIIKQFTAPIEVVQAQANPDADLSYINNLVGLELEADRLSLSPKIVVDTISEEEKANQSMIEDMHFKAAVAKALVSLGVLPSDPTVIPVETL